MLRATWNVIKDTKDYLLIKDMCEQYNCMSITNDAEEVINNLYKTNFINNKIVYYIDTDGRVDILEHDNKGNFLSFKYGFESLEEFDLNINY